MQQLAEGLWAWRNISPYSAKPTGFASPHKKGKQPYWPSTLWREYGRPAVKRAGINKRVSFHTLAHLGTLLNANGENTKVVQELLRHARHESDDRYLHAGGQSAKEGGANQAGRNGVEAGVFASENGLALDLDLFGP